MTRRRLILVAVLLYVGLDLSLPMMPGAFVFDVGDTVESLRVKRARSGAEAPLALPRDSTLPSSARVEVDDRQVAARREVNPRRRPVLTTLPRAALSPSPSSEAH